VIMAVPDADLADAVGGGDFGVPCGNRLKFGHLCVHNLFS